jgi:hypothetical protein
MKTALRATLVCVLALGRILPALAQALPSEPVSLADGHVTISGDVSVSAGSSDAGFFNYTDYEHSLLRLFRVDLASAVKLNGRVSLLGEVRTENLGPLQAYAFYVRVRPWAARAIDIQAGRVPPTFGAFTRRTYASDNLLIGYPLGYQYLTSLRADALPMNANELLAMRGRGWLSSFSIGNPTPDNGLPLASGFRWDTGVQVHAAAEIVDATISVTTGTVSNPLFRDDNSGRQLAGRVSAHPRHALQGLIVGASAAKGPFVTATAARGAVGDGHDGEFTQTALGADVEYSRDYYLVRAETVFSQWKVPAVGFPVIDVPLRALATYVEGRYKIMPGLYAAARIDHVGFSELTGTNGANTWDAPVTRLEVGGGYSVLRNVLLKVSGQHNARDGGRVTSSNLMAAQLVYWF